MQAGQHKDSGFSLIEMMAVLVIISLMTGVVILSAPRNKPLVEQAGGQMLQQLVRASENSIVTGKPQGFGLYEDAYLFYEFSNGEWQAMAETEWPDDIIVSFFKDDIEIELPKEPVPLVIFEPIGLSTEFSLWLESNDQTLIFTSTGDGRVSLENDL